MIFHNQIPECLHPTLLRIMQWLSLNEACDIPQHVSINCCQKTFFNRPKRGFIGQQLGHYAAVVPESLLYLQQILCKFVHSMKVSIHHLETFPDLITEHDICG